MRKIFKNIFFILLVLVYNYSLSQEFGGMWIPNQLNEKEMNKMGMNISAQQIFSADKPSIKDAIAQFGGGCTSEVISPKGLLLTNHHCGYSQIQSHSTLENDLLTQGFWAKDFSGELPNEGLKVTFTVDIKDVTKDVLSGINHDVTEQQRNEIINNNIQKVVASISKKDYQQVNIEPFYEGNQYYAITTETYEDIRLVGAPPSSIGKFGSDTDNWVWPRHTGDFALFRIYADKNNHPAKYSKDNIPYTPKYYLPISIKEKKENDFSFVFGFPGKTQEYLPSSAIEQIIETINPARISLREATLKILDKKMREDKEIKIKYASRYASIANGWKKWIGENQGLKQTNAIKKKQKYEEDFLNYLAKNSMIQSKYEGLLPSFHKIYKENTPYVNSYIYYNEVFYGNSETFKIASLLSSLLDMSNSALESSKAKIKNTIESMQKNYSLDLDAEVSSKLLNMYSTNIDSDFQTAGYESYKNPEEAKKIISYLWQNSFVTDKKGSVDQVLSSTDDNYIRKTIQNDILVKFVSNYFEVYKNKIFPQYYSYQQQLDSLQRVYMKAQLEAFPNKKFYPDANLTLRLSYGLIHGYHPKDAIYYEPFTTLKGVVDKYIPGDYEFDLPQKLINLYDKKDYGVYAQNGQLPVNYMATNHTTGGNSGSPAFDADGNLVGLNFDRVWEGTMSDINYDPSICRNIMVDSRYILFIIDKYANSQRLLKEMKIIK